MNREQPIPQDFASYIWDVLTEVGARESGRDEFIYHQSDKFHSEYRFCGNLGFGGKFWRTVGYRSDGTWGEMWRVNQYPEDERPGDREAIAKVNSELEILLLRWESENA